MSITRHAIERPVLTWLVILFCLFGGLWGFNSVGRLEDPAFTLKSAVIVTAYPGASAEEVEREVTEPLESAVQQMRQLRRVTSKSMPGMSEITVEIEETFPGTELPQIWDELRRRIGDARGDLPDRAHDPQINDDFGDVFGIYYAVTAEGYARRIVGWRVSTSAHAGFVLDALEQAVHDRRPGKGMGLVHHSDRGSQYLSIRYSERLAEAGIEPSVGSVGDSYDNALAETINGLFKAEVIHRRGPWRSFEAVEYATLEWVDWFNNRRLLEPIGNIPPAEAEANFYAALESETLAA